MKCRPPQNRDPRPDEIDACKHFLVDQIRLVDPRAVMTMGNFSTKLLLKTETGITRMRGSGHPLVGPDRDPTFHPAAALRNGPKMVDTMKGDFELAVRTIEEQNEAREHPPPRPSPFRPPTRTARAVLVIAIHASALADTLQVAAPSPLS